MSRFGINMFAFPPFLAGEDQPISSSDSQSSLHKGKTVYQAEGPRHEVLLTPSNFASSLVVIPRLHSSSRDTLQVHLLFVWCPHQ